MGAQVDNVEGMEARFVQVQGKSRDAVAAAGRALGLEGTYIPKSYIEQARRAQLEMHVCGQDLPVVTAGSASGFVSMRECLVSCVADVAAWG